MKERNAARNISDELQLAADKKGNGTLKQIFSAAGYPCKFYVHVWPSMSPSDAALKRGVAYARACFYLEDRFLVTPQDDKSFDRCVSLYTRMRAGIYACLTEHNVTSVAGERLLRESAQAVMYHFANEAFEEFDWEEFAAKVEAQVRKSGGGPVLPQREVSPCSDDAAHDADRALLARLDEIGLNKLDARSRHLSVARLAPAPNPS